MRSCLPSSTGDPQSTISGSPMSTPHQRVARHLAATSCVTRPGPMKNTSGSPLEPPVLYWISRPAVSDFIASVLARIVALSRNGSACRSSMDRSADGSKPILLNSSR